MDDLSREAKNLIASVGNADGPTAEDRQRVKRQLLIAAAASGAAAVASSVAKTAAAGHTLLGAKAAGSGVSTGAGAASTAPAAAALGATAVSNTAVIGTTATLAAAKVSGTTTLLSLSKAAWIAGACLAGAGVTGSLIVQGVSEPASASETAAANKPSQPSQPKAAGPRHGEALPAVPSGAVPSGAVPSGAVPSGAVPSGAVPSGAVPSDAVPSDAVPSGDHQLARASNAVVPAAKPCVNTPQLPCDAAPDSKRALATKASVTQTRAARPAAIAEAQQKVSSTAASLNGLATGAIPAAEKGESELSLLTSAQRALAAGAPQRALVLTDKHTSQFPHSVLRTERAAVRVFALCRLGRVEEARRAGRIFLQDGRNSPLAPRVMESCISNTHSGLDSKTE